VDECTRAEIPEANAGLCVTTQIVQPPLWGEALWGTLPMRWLCRACLLAGEEGEVAEFRPGESCMPQLHSKIRRRLGIQIKDDYFAQLQGVSERLRQEQTRPRHGGVLLANLQRLGRELSLDRDALHLLLLRIVYRLDPTLASAFGA